MSYQTYEQSVSSGKPVELHDILAGTGEHWRYTTAEDTITYNAYDYEPDVIERSELVIGKGGIVEALEVRFGRSNDFANQFIAGPIEGWVTDTIYRGHEGNWITFWHGTMTSITFDEHAIATARFEPRTSSMPRLGSRRRNQRLCDHALYDSGCKVTDSAYRKTGTVSNVSGNVITASIFATESDGWWVGGKLVYGNAVRLIKAHTTNTVTIDRSMTIPIGSVFDVYPGCDHTPSTCLSKFNNKINYGGNEFLPTLNPHEINIMWV